MGGYWDALGGSGYGCTGYCAFCIIGWSGGGRGCCCGGRSEASLDNDGAGVVAAVMLRADAEVPSRALLLLEPLDPLEPLEVVLALPGDRGAGLRESTKLLISTLAVDTGSRASASEDGSMMANVGVDRCVGRPGSGPIDRWAATKV